MEESLGKDKRFCECGCGTVIAAFDKWHNRPRFYANRHSNRGKKFIKPERYEIKCSLCNGMTALNKHGNPVWYHGENGDFLCRSCWDKKKYWEDPDKSRARGRESFWRTYDKRYAYDRKYKLEHVEILRQRRIDYYYKYRQTEINKRIEHRRIHGSTSKRRRKELIAFLGGKCVKCGYDNNVRALMVDHIKGKGTVDRKKYTSLLAYYRFYTNNLDIAKDTLQVLCCNCSAIKQDLKQEYWKDGVFPKPSVTITQ